MHSPHSTGEQFARKLHSLGEAETVALPPHKPLGNFVLTILDGQPDSPLLSAVVNFSGQDPESGKLVLGSFEASQKPLTDTLSLHQIEDLATLE